jgi:hypothetical protein
MKLVQYRLTTELHTVLFPWYEKQNHDPMFNEQCDENKCVCSNAASDEYRRDELAE